MPDPLLHGQRRSEFAGATWHYQFARCPECGNATIGLRTPYAINHAAGCSMPADEIERVIRAEQRAHEVTQLLAEHGRIVRRLGALGVDVEVRTDG